VRAFYIGWGLCLIVDLDRLNLINAIQSHIEKKANTTND